MYIYNKKITDTIKYLLYNLLPKLPKYKTLKRFCQAPLSHLKGFGAIAFFYFI